MKKIAHKNRSLSKGFSTIELIITLFVASAFLFSGYQLYTMIIKDGGETRAQARASNAAYGYLQEYKADSSITTICPNGLDVDGHDKLFNESPTTPITGLSNVNVLVDRTCPYPGTPAINKIEVTLTYGNNKSVTQATYVNAT